MIESQTKSGRTNRNANTYSHKMTISTTGQAIGLWYKSSFESIRTQKHNNLCQTPKMKCKIACDVYECELLSDESQENCVRNNKLNEINIKNMILFDQNLMTNNNGNGLIDWLFLWMKFWFNFYAKCHLNWLKAKIRPLNVSSKWMQITNR